MNPEPDPRPLPPERPSSQECCHSGCDVCIFDLYEQALERYQEELAAWEARQPHLRQPHLNGPPADSAGRA